MLPNQTLKAVERYEQDIQTVLLAWPEITIFDLTHGIISPLTFTNRFRDAIQGIIKHHQQHYITNRKIDINKLMSIDRIYCRQHEDLVIVGPQAAVKAWRTDQRQTSGAEAFTASAKQSQALSIETRHMADVSWEKTLSSISHLVARNIIQNGVIVRGLTSTQAQSLEELSNLYDINVVQQEPGTFLIL